MNDLLFGLGAGLVGFLLIALGLPWWIPAGALILFSVFE